MMPDVLIVFVKYPEPGRVKTRLAKAIGEQKAAALYKLFVEAVLGNVSSGRYATAVFFDPREQKKEIERWLSDAHPLYPQEGRDLGQRLYNAFSVTFSRGAKRVIAIGTDTPLIEEQTIRDAFVRLSHHGCVLGPSLDGGYYLIGLRHLHEELFRNIPWSTHTVLEETVKAARRIQLPVSFLDTLIDVDTNYELSLLKGQLNGLAAGDTAVAQLKAYLTAFV